MKYISVDIRSANWNARWVYLVLVFLVHAPSVKLRGRPKRTEITLI